MKFGNRKLPLLVVPMVDKEIVCSVRTSIVMVVHFHQVILNFEDAPVRQLHTAYSQYLVAGIIPGLGRFLAVDEFRLECRQLL